MSTQPNWAGDVFLGGSCGTTGSIAVWREQVAIPAFEQEGISYCNPQLQPGSWHHGLIKVEREAKRRCRYLMMVIAGTTRAIASIQEATTYVMMYHDDAALRRQVFLVIDPIQEGTVIGGVELTGKDLADANRGREFLRDDVATFRPDLVVWPTVEDAVAAVIDADRAREAAAADCRYFPLVRG